MKKLSSFLIAAAVIATPFVASAASVGSTAYSTKSVRTLDKYAIRKAAKSARTRTPQRTLVSPSASNAFLSVGEKDAPVTITEFTDYECPFCRRFHLQTYVDLKKDYIDTGKVRFVIRHYPLPFHAHAMEAAVAVECAREQGNAVGVTISDSIWILQEAGNDLTEKNILKYAGMYGEVNADALATCMDGDTKAASIAKDMEAAQAAKVNGTPTFILAGPDGKKASIVGAQPYAAFQKAIDKLLK